MSHDLLEEETYQPDGSETALSEPDGTGLTRRTFVKILGAGLMIGVAAGTALGQRGGAAPGGGGKRGGGRGGAEAAADRGPFPPGSTSAATARSP